MQKDDYCCNHEISEHLLHEKGMAVHQVQYLCYSLCTTGVNCGKFANDNKSLKRANVTIVCATKFVQAEVLEWHWLTTKMCELADAGSSK